MIRTAFVAAAALALSAAAAFADDALGDWRTQPDDNGNFGVVRMAPCSGKICGQLVSSYNSAGQPIASERIGTMIVKDMSPNGGGAYSGGTIYAPDRDKTYRSKMELTGNTLKVSGCVGPICRTQTWTRVN